MFIKENIIKGPAGFKLLTLDSEVKLYPLCLKKYSVKLQFGGKIGYCDKKFFTIYRCLIIP